MNRAVNDPKSANLPEPPVERSRFGLGYKSFVAWRYLMDAHRKRRPGTLWMLLIGAAAALVLALLRSFVTFGVIYGHDALEIV